MVCSQCENPLEKGIHTCVMPGPPPNDEKPWTGKSDMQPRAYLNGMTVAELKEMVRDWPETDEFGEPCEVWLCDGQGLSNQALMATPLNMRQSEDKTKVWADFMLGHGA